MLALMQVTMPSEGTNPYAWFLVIALGGVGFVFKLYNDGQSKRIADIQAQVVAGEKRELALKEESARRESALILDNKEQATVIGKLGISVDKLTEQAGQTIRLLEDVVYGRESETKRRSP